MKLEISSLSKTMKKKKILKDIDLQILPGQCLALKGSNGSGKTSLIKIMAGMDTSYKGELRCIGYDRKKDIGYIPQEIVLFDDLSVWDNLKIFSKVADNKKIKELLAYYDYLFSIHDIMNTKISKLSGGKKRLVNILVGLLNNPRVILMDEPTVGLDEETIRHLIFLIHEIKEKRIFVLCSHHEAFLKETCNRYMILDKGSVIEEGSYE